MVSIFCHAGSAILSATAKGGDDMAEIGSPSDSPRGRDFASDRAAQNFPRALLAGIASALAGAVLWAAIVFFTGIKGGALIAFFFGGFVGGAVRQAGKGVESIFGLLGGVCSMVGWVLGTTIGFAALMNLKDEASSWDAVMQVHPQQLVSIAMNYGVIDLVMLVVAFAVAYRVSISRY
jgi:hypothetical protein